MRVPVGVLDGGRVALGETELLELSGVATEVLGPADTGRAGMDLVEVAAHEDDEDARRGVVDHVFQHVRGLQDDTVVLEELSKQVAVLDQELSFIDKPVASVVSDHLRPYARA